MEHGKAKARVTLLHNEVRLVRGRLGLSRTRQNLGDLVIEICRERATPSEWQYMEAEARWHEAQTALENVGAPPAGIASARVGASDGSETDSPPAALHLDNK